jgi:hypothetical protein
MIIMPLEETSLLPFVISYHQQHQNVAARMTGVEATSAILNLNS